MGSLCPFCLNTPSKYFFADITGVEKNPWTTMKTDERLHLETSALENSLRNGNQVVTLSTQLIKSNFLIAKKSIAKERTNENSMTLLMYNYHLTQTLYASSCLKTIINLEATLPTCEI